MMQYLIWRCWGRSNARVHSFNIAHEHSDLWRDLRRMINRGVNFSQAEW